MKTTATDTTVFSSSSYQEEVTPKSATGPHMKTTATDTIVFSSSSYQDQDVPKSTTGLHMKTTATDTTVHSSSYYMYKEQDASKSATDQPMKTMDQTVYPGCVGSPNGADYRGDVSVTRSGKICQHWDANSPHNHYYWTSLFPELEENYCRNPAPDTKYGVWCYTTDPSTEWEYCINPACPKGNRGTGCLEVEVNERVKCGPENSPTRLGCEAQGCCYNASILKAHWCYFGTDKDRE
ncbi:plasminogen-like [Branchiostoma lanceolatum]|uniref:plasminogen-like n=1 Tax=Branchiostoma lanceolatum TaxID=7740 RepID=UPI00345289F2